MTPLGRATPGATRGCGKLSSTTPGRGLSSSSTSSRAEPDARPRLLLLLWDSRHSHKAGPREGGQTSWTDEWGTIRVVRHSRNAFIRFEPLRPFRNRAFSYTEVVRGHFLISTNPSAQTARGRSTSRLLAGHARARRSSAHLSLRLKPRSVHCPPFESRYVPI